MRASWYLASALAGLLAAPALQAAESGLQTEVSGALQLNFDRPAGAYRDAKDSLWESGVRNAELGFGATYGERWSAELELGMGRGDAEPSVDDAYIGYAINDVLSLRGGRFKAAYGLENSSSGKNVWFNERAMAADALASERGDGIGVSAALGPLNASLAFTRFDNKEDDAQLSGFYSRLVYSGEPGKRKHWHLGASLGQVAYDTARYRVRSDAELDLSGSVLKSPKKLDAVDVLLYAVEAAWVNGPLGMQGEYLAHAVDPLSGEDFTLDGYALSASWFLDKTSHRYSAGKLRSVKPKGDDALELVARHGCLDLRAQDKGDAGCTTGLGINYYWKRQMRLSANYLRLTREEDKSSGKAWSIRAQWRF